MIHAISTHPFAWTFAVSLFLLPAFPQTAADSSSLWATLNAQGSEAYSRGSYGESEKSYTAALALAEKFGERDDRLATSLSNLGTTCRAQGHYAEAEKLYSRAVEIREKALGAEDPPVAVILNNLTTLYHAQG